MSFYRSVLAAIAAIALASPVFADDTTSTDTSSGTSMTSSTDQSASTTTEQTKVDINKASTKELMKIKGISSARAKAIVTYRKKNGEFKSLDDLTKVTGFKNMNSDMLKGIQDQLTVQ